MARGRRAARAFRSGVAWFPTGLFDSSEKLRLIESTPWAPLLWSAASGEDGAPVMACILAHWMETRMNSKKTRESR
ncbi:hypothetical protein OE88DRAFT_1661192 [Heliocybe sulcata]|uniref:Uncharacterized protein n=1 Tax=Heliocybe sulcata TaxID=5364 RepID=A0A5C3N0T3_9AGAM|nr:hypothetical protein OE88DRAFT_1661192 [Heliocybe sulcata]